MWHKKDTLRKITYVALDFTTGLTDLVLKVRKPDGSLFGTFNFVEISPGGVYEASYTPNELGKWQEEISSPTNGDKLINTIMVTEEDIDGISDKIDDLDVKVRPGGYIA